jgi:hypothetical protein
VIQGTPESDFGRRFVAKTLFPGEWQNTWRHANGQEGVEKFKIDEDGQYLIDGKPTFAIKLVDLPAMNRVIIEKKRLRDGKPLIEDLKIEGETLRVFDDGRGASVRYERIAPVAEGNVFKFF